MKTRSTALLVAAAAAAALAAPVAAQDAAPDPVLGSVAITWDEIMAIPLGSSGRARQLMRVPTATLDELEMHITWLPAGQTTHARTRTRTKKSSSSARARWRRSRTGS